MGYVLFRLGTEQYYIEYKLAVYAIKLTALIGEGSDEVIKGFAAKQNLEQGFRNCLLSA